MAENFSLPSMGSETLPSSAATYAGTYGSTWGISSTIADCIIQDVSISKQMVTDVTQDQKGAVVQEMDYDCRWDGSMTVIGPTNETAEGITGLSAGMTDFQWAGYKWKVDSIQFVGNYQSKKLFTISFHRTKHFPAQS